MDLKYAWDSWHADNWTRVRSLSFDECLAETRNRGISNFRIVRIPAWFPEPLSFEDYAVWPMDLRQDNVKKEGDFQ